MNTLKENGVTLTFVSIGDDEKLTNFLTLNPAIPTDRSFVDISATFDLYEAAGFRKIGDQTPDNLTVNLKPPNLGAKQVRNFPTRRAPPVPDCAHSSFPKGRCFPTTVYVTHSTTD